LSRANLFDDRVVLRFETQFERLLAILVHRKQIEVIVYPAMENAALIINSGVDERVRLAAIFCLNVESDGAEFEIRIVPEDHAVPLLLVQEPMQGAATRRTAEFSGTFDRWRLTRYYNSSTMTPSDLHAYVPLLIHLLVAAFLAGALILVSTFIGWRRPSKVKAQPYECGITPTGDAREPFSVKFYLVAMVFILFDVEAIFLYPWAYIFKDLARNAATRWFGFIEMMFYVAILLVGYIYLWKKGALDWHKSRK
jgi:NADH-quinone oxidoreductase subunit A